MPERQKTIDLRFPLGGIDLSMGYTMQRPGTSPRAINVRGFDAGTQRLRGGSRPGLRPFLGKGSTAQVAGFHLIQSLTTIVWVNPSAIV